MSDIEDLPTNVLIKKKRKSIKSPDNEEVESLQDDKLDETLNNISWKLLDKYFTEKPHHLVAHHLDTYNDFFDKGINNIFRENNPIRFIERKDKERNEIKLYLGGKSGKLIYIGKPVIHDETDDRKMQYMYPNYARLRNLTYSVTIHYDIEVDYTYYIEDGDSMKRIDETDIISQIYLGRFPIMLQSNLCVLKGLPEDIRFNLGECKYDYGGYFIIDGKEKVIIPQEKFANNMIYVKKNAIDNIYNYSADIRSVSEDTSKPIRTFSIRMVAPDTKYTNNQIVVVIPNVKKPVPLFIVMRALGIITDKDIIKCCILDLEKNSDYLDLFIPSIHDAGQVFTQITALEYIAVLTKKKTINSALYILMDLLLTHIGEDNFIEKAYFLGYMVFKMLKVVAGVNSPTDRDNYKFKRIELSGDLFNDIFREYYLIQNKEIMRNIDKKYYYHKDEYIGEKFKNLIDSNYLEYFKERTVETGLKKAFKGNWGADKHTKRIGVVQDLNRLSYFTFISQLRKLSLPLDSGAKVVGPRLLNSSQWGYIDPIDTPDGENIGLHKHLSITTYVTNHISSKSVVEWLRANMPTLYRIQDSDSHFVSKSTKVFVNGLWAGVIIASPIDYVEDFKLYRRNGVIPIYISISFDYENNEIHIFSDSGRLSRPIYYVDKTKTKTKKQISGFEYLKKMKNQTDITWNNIISGFLPKVQQDKIDTINKLYNIQEIQELYPDISRSSENSNLIASLDKNKGIIDYVDTSEEEGLLIANHIDQLVTNKYYSHYEILPSLILGVMGNLIIFSSNNPVTRNAFSCGQSKQAVSVFNTNYQMRMDKMAVVLNNGQIPLIKSKYLKYINNEDMPYGVNTIVAIMSYTGYNVEDAILINEGSIKRGLFSTTYYTTYESREESSQVGKGDSNAVFGDVISMNIKGLKAGYDYTYIDKSGLVKENTEINDRIVVIGKYSYNAENRENLSDSSVFTKKGQLGVVDKSFITEGEEGFRIAKVRITENRIPGIGDKMASRAGQKGTIGLIIPEEDMPFTSDGIRPDLIINPHAIPSRMTIGQLIESILGKVCATYGGFGDCTAFETKGNHSELYGKLLTNAGFHSSGNQVLYNGYSGEQLFSDIYIGPTYYMRLKHMVKDKINYRARGPNTALTRQPVQGRANDGGLRIGEMERDGVLAHGASAFLNDSFMVRGDEYYLAVCNKTGGIAIYNKDLNIFLSPYVDGPIQFTKSLDGSLNIENISKYGRSFSIVRVPYSLKLLIQELQGMNIQMKIVTEDNIDQLLSMSYSDNIQLLLRDNTELTHLLPNYSTKIKNILKNPNANANQQTSRFMTKNANKKLPDMIDDDLRVSVITSFQEAVDIGKRCLQYINKTVPNRDPFENADMAEFATKYLPYFNKYTNNTNTNQYQMNDTYLENTMRYIFDVLHHTCYFLCVYGGEKGHKLYKLSTKTTSPIISKVFNSEFNRKVRRNDSEDNPEVKLSEGQINTIEYTLSKPYRVMGCIVKSINLKNDNDNESIEYKRFFDDLRLPSGIFVFNLNDSMILEKNDNNQFIFPWNILSRQEELSKYGIIPKFIPIFSLSGRKGYVDIPIPNYDDIPSYSLSPSMISGQISYMATINKNMIEHDKYNIYWGMKIKRAIFRGGATGCGYTTTTNQRLKLVKMIEDAKDDPTIPETITDLFDVGIVNNDKTTNVSINTSSIRNDPKYNIGLMNTEILSSDWVSMIEQSKYKYIIFVDGNVNAYRLLNTFLTGSLIVRVMSNFTSWVEPLIYPYDIHSTNNNQYAHYIPVRDDMSDLFSVMEWCESNSEICKQIATNALNLSRDLIQPGFIKKYTEMMLWLSKVGIDGVKISELSNSDIESGNISSSSQQQQYFSPGTPDYPPPQQQYFSPSTPDYPPVNPIMTNEVIQELNDIKSEVETIKKTITQSDDDKNDNLSEENILDISNEKIVEKEKDKGETKTIKI